MADHREEVDTVPLPEIAQGAAESWVQLLPSGTFKLNDKRGPWVVKDMASVIAASQADVQRGMPVDMDHALDRRNEAEAPAAGWIEELVARQDGIWARIAWTATGKAKIDGREYRFISPVVMVSKTGEVQAIKRAGLTNAPAIAMKAICSVEDEGVAPGADHDEAGPAQDAASMLRMLREAMGAPPEMPVPELMKRARAIIAAAGRTQTDSAPAKELASSYMKLLAEVHGDRVETALERARASGKLLPYMEGWAVELASENLDKFEAWEAITPVMIQPGRMLAGAPPAALLGNGRFRGRDERLAVCAQLGLDPDELG